MDNFINSSKYLPKKDPDFWSNKVRIPSGNPLGFLVNPFLNQVSLKGFQKDVFGAIKFEYLRNRLAKFKK